MNPPETSRYVGGARDAVNLGDTLLAGDDWGRIHRLPSSGEGKLVATLAGAVNAFVATEWGIFLPSGEHREQALYRSSNGGFDWDNINPELTELRIHDLAAHPSGAVFVATHLDGVIYSSDHGLTSKPINNGLPSLTVTALAITPDDYLYAVTGSGVYRIPLSVATDAEYGPETRQMVLMR